MSEGPIPCRASCVRPVPNKLSAGSARVVRAMISVRSIEHGWLVSEQTNDDELDPFPPMPWGASPPDQDIITGFAYLPSSQLALIKDLVLIFGFCVLPTYLYHSLFRNWATSRTKYVRTYVLRCERYQGKISPHNNAISSEALETCQVPNSRD